MSSDRVCDDIVSLCLPVQRPRDVFRLESDLLTVPFQNVSNMYPSPPNGSQAGQVP